MYRLLGFWTFLLTLALAGCGESPALKEETQDSIVAPPMMDGSCDEYAALGVQSSAVAPDVSLYVFQDDHFVWFCYTYPEGSFGTLDLRVASEALEEPINLHVSAQLGEWPADRDEAAPDNPESNLWWNMEGWIANPVWTNGMNREVDPPRYRFKNSPARELQLAKARFGRGEWNLSFEIRAIRREDGKLHTVEFPVGWEPFLLVVS